MAPCARAHAPVFDHYRLLAARWREGRKACPHPSDATIPDDDDDDNDDDVSVKIDTNRRQRWKCS